MTIWKTTLVTGVALGTAITIGVVDTAIGAQDYRGYHPQSYHRYHGYHSQSYHQHNQLDADLKSGNFIHPVYGYTFKHPVHGYKFKHPMLGYIPVANFGQAPNQ